MPFLLFLRRRGIPLSMYRFHILQIIIVTPTLQNVRDRGKRGLIFITIPTCKQRNRCSFETGKREVGEELSGMAVKL